MLSTILRAAQLPAEIISGWFKQTSFPPSSSGEQKEVDFCSHFTEGSPEKPVSTLEHPASATAKVATRAAWGQVHTLHCWSSFQLRT